MGMSWMDYISMPYSAAMAAMEGYIIRTQKMDANFRRVAWHILCSFADTKDPRFPKDPSQFWPLEIDKLFKEDEEEDDSPEVSREDLLKLKDRLCR